MTETLLIPLNKLVAWDGNVRRTGASEAIDELAASIAAHGLLQAPVVRKVPGKKGNGKYAVIAGRRRLQALQLLANRGDLAGDWPVPCQPIDDAADAGEISLAENVVRVAMHPADQFEAFSGLLERGTDVSAIAARFGVTESVVAKRLKLGRLSPGVLDAYRAGDIGLEEAQAFTIVDDHAAQERVLADLKDWSFGPSQIRQRLTEGEVSATDKRVRFIGLEAYEQAGGGVRRDLFDDADSGTILDPALLDRLVTDRLAVSADTVRTEGWAWVETAADFDRSMLSEFRRVHPTQLDPTETQQEQLAALSAEYDALVDAEDDEAITDRLAAIERDIDAIEESLTVWSPETLAAAGAIVSLSWNGEVAIERGLVRRGDESDEVSVGEPEKRGPAEISTVLIADLTAEKTAALQVALGANAKVALATVVHALALPVFYTGACCASCIEVTLRVSHPERHIANPDSVRALNVNADREMTWARLLPEQEEELWPWCFTQPQETLLSLQAFLVAQGLNAVRHKGDRPNSYRLVHADALAQALELDMAAWFTPTAENYFSRISSAQIVEALCEAKGGTPAPAWSKMKKAELAAFAARELTGSGWLPSVLRPGEIVPVNDDELPV